ncbi:MAG: carbohydrate kinase, partial [Thermomicrobiales bacterium]|nr:carbohydrate kinase [Thermomicrobiales bacterium]
MTLLLGLDVGTTSVKAVVYRTDGIAVSSASLPTPTHVPRPGWAYFNPDELWDTAAAAMRRAIADVEDPTRIAAVAVTSMGESGVLIGARG